MYVFLVMGHFVSACTTFQRYALSALMINTCTSQVRYAREKIVKPCKNTCTKKLFSSLKFPQQQKSVSIHKHALIIYNYKP